MPIMFALYSCESFLLKKNMSASFKILPIILGFLTHGDLSNDTHEDLPNNTHEAL